MTALMRQAYSDGLRLGIFLYYLITFRTTNTQSVSRFGNYIIFNYSHYLPTSIITQTHGHTEKHMEYYQLEVGTSSDDRNDLIRAACFHTTILCCQFELSSSALAVYVPLLHSMCSISKLPHAAFGLKLKRRTTNDTRKYFHMR